MTQPAHHVDDDDAVRADRRAAQRRTRLRAAQRPPRGVRGLSGAPGRAAVGGGAAAAAARGRAAARFLARAAAGGGPAERDSPAALVHRGARWRRRRWRRCSWSWPAGTLYLDSTPVASSAALDAAPSPAPAPAPPAHSRGAAPTVACRAARARGASGRGSHAARRAGAAGSASPRRVPAARALRPMTRSPRRPASARSPRRCRTPRPRAMRRPGAAVLASSISDSGRTLRRCGGPRRWQFWRSSPLVIAIVARHRLRRASHH